MVLTSPLGLRANQPPVTDPSSPPKIVNRLPEPNSTVRTLKFVEVIFNEQVQGVDTNDLLINGVVVTNVYETLPGQYVFEFPEPSPGTVQITWALEHGIRDYDSPSLTFSPDNWSYTLEPVPAKPKVYINEFMAENRNTLNDKDGDSTDWIEIYNAEDVTLNLEGWFLTDTAGTPAKWRFPAVSILAKSFLVVFASEKNRTNSSDQLHTNFKLEKGGEYLGLYNQATNVLSEFAPVYPPQDQDVSYGREQSDPSITGYFPKATPGAVNVPGGPGFAPEVKFSEPGRTFVEPFELKLTTSMTNAVIRYNIGTNMPTETSTVYTASILLTNSSHVRARAFVPGWLPGPPHSENYIMLHTNIVGFTSDLPLIILHNHGLGVITSGSDKFVMMQVFEPKDGRASLTNTPDLSVRAKFKLRGSSTEGYQKGSYALETFDEFGVDVPAPLLGMPADSDWVFYAPNNFEPVLIHNPFMYELSRRVGRYATRTRFAEVYLRTTSGSISTQNYNGIYVVEERIKRGPDRVDVDKLEPEYANPPEVTGGYMLKVDRADPADGGFSAGGVGLLYVYPKEREIETIQRDPQEKYIAKYINDFGRALNSTNWTNKVTGYWPYVDADSWIDHSVLNVLAFNVDALRLSTYLYKPRLGPITYGPIWDFDRALGSTDGRDQNPRVMGDSFFTYPWWGRMFRDPDFFQKWVDRWQELRDSHFSQGALEGLVDHFVNQVRRAQPREQQKWRIIPRGGSYQGEVRLMKQWLSNRVSFIDTNFLFRPKLSREGGRIASGQVIEITPPVKAGSEVYYFLDGTDPRREGGALNTNAILYTGPITVTNNVRLVARARNLSHRNRTGGNDPPISTPWSGVIAATYVVSTPPLLITELMYNPRAGLTGDTNGSDSFEFIELKNAGTNSLNLSGFKFTQGISFNFSTGAVQSLGPGERVLVVKDEIAFKQRYPGATRIAGQYEGNLSNQGERIALEGPLGEPIHDFSYEPGWNRITDGTGFALVPNDETADPSQWNFANHWRAGSRLDGTPASPEVFPGIPPRVVVNELLAHTSAPLLDSVELLNLTDAEVDISGWYLSDDREQPRKFRFPSGSRLPARGFLTVTEQSFNTGTNGFAFGNFGDEVYLFSADASGELTGYMHGFEFGPSNNGVSFGRVVTSEGREHFAIEKQVSFRQPNQGPATGPLVISEIMYQVPSGTDYEFIELHNASSSPLNLRDWKLRGAVDYDLPDATLPAGGYITLVSFDPALNIPARGAFLQRFGLDNSVALLGPFQGRLDDAGESLRLLRTGQFATAPNNPEDGLVLIEQIDYESSVPWPLPRQGESLQRLQLAGFANELLHWQAFSPTPGRANATRVLRINSIQAAPLKIQFAIDAGTSYTVQYRENVAQGAWQKLMDIPAQPNAGWMDVEDPGANQAKTRFYRVVTPQQN